MDSFHREPAEISQFLRKTYRKLAGKREPDAYLVSFPKCGRTWLRVMLGRALYRHAGIEDEKPDGTRLLYPEGVKRMSSMPLVSFTHDSRPNRSPVAKITADKSRYAGTKVILLIRDLRDVAVSYYFHETRRTKRFYPKWAVGGFDGGITEFLHSEIGGVRHFVRFYNIWAENRHVPQRLLLMKYEEIHQQPCEALEQLLSFLGLTDVSAQVIEEAVEFASFNKMRSMESQGSFAHPHYMKPGDRSDQESFKVRKGKVGGYGDYLSAEDVAWIEDKMRNELAPYYGYQEVLSGAHVEPG